MECLEKYLYKTVKIETFDGHFYNGKVDMYWSEDDDEYGEGIGICLNKETNRGVGIYKSDIKSIEEVE